MVHQRDGTLGFRFGSWQIEHIESASPPKSGHEADSRLVPGAAVSDCSKVPFYSITSSARASSAGGTSSPSVLAVLRLITNSYLVGACTGRSAGFSPLRMRPTYGAPRRYWSARFAPYETSPPPATNERSK